MCQRRIQSCYHRLWWFLSSCQGLFLNKPILASAGTIASIFLRNFLYVISSTQCDRL